ncbi:hypothetical protein M3Y99_01473800 [Aphelenchoides fujianensis]|nr:hypothetical protein M3Y99_01473800 [Aphelenchoides fujianensis]
MVKRRPAEYYSSSEEEDEKTGGQLGVDETEESGDDTDREIQVAFEQGLLPKDGLVTVGRPAAAKRPPINKKEALRAKLAEIRQKIPWSGTLDVAFDEELRLDTNTDDFKRDSTMQVARFVSYDQALSAVRKAIPLLEKEGIPVFRPDDYFAEMSKTDAHMQKASDYGGECSRVRQRLLDIQKDKERSESAKRQRDERKFAAQTKIAAVEQKQQTKRKLMEAVKQHRKGMKSQLETMLDNAAEFNDHGVDDGEEFAGRKGRKPAKMSRNARNKKFGYGGQKKRSKRNDKESFNNVFEGKRKPKAGGVSKRRR